MKVKSSESLDIFPGYCAVGQGGFVDKKEQSELQRSTYIAPCSELGTRIMYYIILCAVEMWH